MRHAQAVAAGLLLAGPTVLAFFSGGFFDEARLWAGLAAWALVAVGAVTWPRGGRVRSAGVVAVAALAGLCAWTAASAAWAPLSGPALADLQRLVLYLGALVAGLLLLPAVPRAVEPAVAAGCVVVIGYGLAGRLLPGLIEQEASRSAFGRLEQPLTYWNATGLLAAIGAVLAVRLAGDATRGRGLRAAAGAAVPALACGLVLSFSRGALVACAAGVVAVCVLAPDRGQLRAVAATVACALPAVATAVALDGVRALGGDAAARERDGLVVLLVLVAGAGAAAWLASRRAAPGGGRRRPVAAAAVGAGIAVAALAVAAGTGTRTGTPAIGATPARLASADTNRYDYWTVALDEWRAQPLRGGGAGSFRVAWLRERRVREAAQDAHSLYVETLAELGVVGAALLLAFLAAAGVAAGRAPAAAAGSVAALLVWALHAGVDWDWEMPAVTLPALLLAAHVMSGDEPRAPVPAAGRGRAGAAVSGPAAD